MGVIWPLILAMPLLGIVSCSQELNLNGYLAAPFEENAVDLRSRAYHLYDKGKYQDALPFASKAMELDPESEEGGILLGSIHMGLAGIDSFQLIENLSSDSAGLEGESASSSLSSLSSILGLSTSELSALTLDGNEKDGVEGAPASGFFSELPVLLPKTAPEARLSGGDTLYHISQAILALCPFVADGVKVLGEGGDIRHTSDQCASKGNGDLKGKSHFSWAFAHLAEAILFHEVVLYNPEGTTPNLQARGALLGTSGASLPIATYISTVNELAAVTDIIMPTSDEEAATSMLQALFQDLEAASKGFSSLPGIPDSITGGIVGSLNELTSQRDAITPSDGVSEDSSAMKNQLTSGLAAELRTQITAKEGSISAAEKDELCTAYQQISTTPFDSCS